jgi:hypothetical protein
MAPKNKKKSGFQSVINNLKTSIMKVQSQDISSDIDSSLARISSSIMDKHSSNYAEMIKTTFSDIITQKFDFKHMSKEFFQSFVNAERFVRYANAEEIADSIPYCARALKVISDEIVAPDEIDKSIINVIQEDSELESVKLEKTNIDSLMKALEFERYIHDLIYETLKLGDQFVEVCDYTSEDIPLTQMILNEGLDNIDENIALSETIDIGYADSYIQETGVDDFKMTLRPVVVEAASNKTNKVEISKVRLIFHDPRYVIKLQSQRFKMCLGYVILPRYQYSGAIGGDPRGTYLKSMLYGMDDYKDLTGIDKLYSQIMGTIKQHVGNQEFSVNKKEVMNMMARCLKEFENERHLNFKVRYVAPDNIEHFTLSSRRFFPYGEGIFYKTTFSAKLLIALESAVTVKRISDSTDARVFYIETGVPRNARDVIEEVREARTKKKVSLDKFGSIGSIPSMITSYEDYYIPQVNGKRFMEFDTLPPAQNVRDATEELKYFRDILIASMEIPPSFISLEENLCCRDCTIIPLLNGNKLQLKDIIEQYDKGVRDMYTYSIDPSTNNIIPNKITWAGYTKRNTQCIRVWLDNDKYLDCTPDHKIMMRDGTYKEAQLLQPNDSIMPLYTKNKKINSSGLCYEQIYHPGDCKYGLTYHMVRDYFNIKKGSGLVCHHLDYDPRNNNPNNLISMSTIEHNSLHGREGTKIAGSGSLYVTENCAICGKEFERKFSLNKVTCSDECRSKYHAQTGYKSWKSREKKLREKYPILHKTCDWCSKEYDLIPDATYNPNIFHSCGDPHCTKRLKSLNISIGKSHGKMSSRIDYTNCEICNKPIITSQDNSLKVLKNVCRSTKCINTVLGRRAAEQKKAAARVKLTCPQCGKEFEQYKWYIKERKNPPTCGSKECRYLQIDAIRDMKSDNEQVSFMNHKVVKIELLEGLYDTGDITVENHHNFAIDAGIFIHNSNKNALTFENILFARTVVSYQTKFARNLRGLFNKLHKMVYGEQLLPTTNITFYPPKMLQAERQSEHIRVLADLINTLKDLGLNADYLKHKYLPIDWEEHDAAETAANLDKHLEPKEDIIAGSGGGIGGQQGF